MSEAISEALRQLVTNRAQGYCEYCQSLEAYATERFSIEHILLRALGGTNAADNLALACQGCMGTNQKRQLLMTRKLTKLFLFFIHDSKFGKNIFPGVQMDY